MKWDPGESNFVTMTISSEAQCHICKHSADYNVFTVSSVIDYFEYFYVHRLGTII